MPSGNFVWVFHSHLPWVLHHGITPHGVDWLSEAVAECYIPLLNTFNKLLSEGIPANVSMDISPVLCEQLEHPDFKIQFMNYCERKIDGARKDEKDFREKKADPHQIYMAQYWQQWYFDRKRDFFEKYHTSIVGAMKSLQDAGVFEVLTCAATHGYLPLLPTDRSIDLQIHTAVENYRKYFGRNPRGIWLPECAYRPSYEWKSLLPIAPFNMSHLRPGIEQFLAKYGIEFFFIDEKLTERAYPIGLYYNYNKENFISVKDPSFQGYFFDKEKLPLNIFQVSSSDKVEYGTAAAFTRFQKISMQVWSAEVGYPGNPLYLDFHKIETESRIRYRRVTDNKGIEEKQLYHPDWTHETLDLQANHFIHHIENTANWYNRETGKFCTVCIPFDTELFGHWWFEGPEFIENVIRGLHHSPWVNTAKAGEQMNIIKPHEVYGIPEGSWGVNNNHDVWSNEDNKWTWVKIYDNENRLKKILEKFPFESMTALVRRILTQALRELMLLEASDWQFIIFTGAARDYAEMRFSNHNTDFNKLCDLAIEIAEVDKLNHEQHTYLTDTEARNSVFPELRLEWWSH